MAPAATALMTKLRHILNPPSPFERFSVEWLDVPPEISTKVYEEHAKSIVSTNDSPDVPFRYSINPYRGCFHACAYCYARPTHQYLDFGAGTDFERNLIVKVNAPELLQKAFDKASWTGETIVFSGVTDCYQPLEATYELTRQCLEICLAYRNPVGIITKGALIRRDIDLLAELHEKAGVTVYLSIAFLDDMIAQTLEPGAPRPSTRFRVMEQLASKGVPVGIAVAPVICGINDHEIPALLRRAHESGATSAFMTLLRLPAEVRPVFEERIHRLFPLKAQRALNQVREMRQGKFNSDRSSNRMTGQGRRWQAIDWMFQSNCAALGFHSSENKVRSGRSTFQRPTDQLPLF